MDPNETLAELRKAVSDMYAADPVSASESEAGSRVEHAFSALDSWLSRGGFLPDAWKVGR